MIRRQKHGRKPVKNIPDSRTKRPIAIIRDRGLIFMAVVVANQRDFTRLFADSKEELLHRLEVNNIALAQNPVLTGT